MIDQLNKRFVRAASAISAHSLKAVSIALWAGCMYMFGSISYSVAKRVYQTRRGQPGMEQRRMAKDDHMELVTEHVKQKPTH